MTRRFSEGMCKLGQGHQSLQVITISKKIQFYGPEAKVGKGLHCAQLKTEQLPAQGDENERAISTDCSAAVQRQKTKMRNPQITFIHSAVLQGLCYMPNTVLDISDTSMNKKYILPSRSSV